MSAYAYRAPYCGALSFMLPQLAAPIFSDCFTYGLRGSLHVRSWHLADIATITANVRFPA
jgi:hypothetical protein